LNLVVSNNKITKFLDLSKTRWKLNLVVSKNNKCNSTKIYYFCYFLGFLLLFVTICYFLSLFSLFVTFCHYLSLFVTFCPFFVPFCPFLSRLSLFGSFWFFLKRTDLETVWVLGTLLNYISDWKLVVYLKKVICRTVETSSGLKRADSKKPTTCAKILPLLNQNNFSVMEVYILKQ